MSHTNLVSFNRITRRKDLFFFVFFCLSFFFFLSSANAASQIPITVSKGTNLIKFTNQFCLDPANWQEIATINNIKPPYIIQENSELLVPLHRLLFEEASVSVASVSGKVQILSQDQTSKPATAGDTLSQGSTIATDSESYALLVFPDQKYIRLESDSSLTLQYALRLKDGSYKIETLLNKGRSVNSLDWKLKMNESFRTRTPSVLAGVRGTEFRLKSDSSNSSQIETLTGKVLASNSSGKDVQVSSGQGIKSILGEPLGKPQSLPATPVADQFPAVFKVQPLSFTLPGHANAAAIRVRISRDLRGFDSLLEKTVSPGQKVSLVLPGDGSYFAQFTAIDKEGFESIPSTSQAFLLRTTPSAPVLTSPKAQATLFEKKVTVTWLAVEQAALYRCQLAHDKDFKDIIEQKETTNTSIEISQLPPGDYYLRVQSQAADSFTSLFTDVNHFKIAEPPKLATTEPIHADKVELRWSSMGENVRYDMEIDTASQFSAPVLQANLLTEPVYTPKSPLQPGTYYLHIRATLDDGQQTPWTPAMKLVIEPAPFGVWDMIMIGVIGVCTLL